MQQATPLPQYVLWLIIAMLAGLPIINLLITAFSHPDIMQAILTKKSTLLATWHSFYTSFVGMMIAVVLGGFFAFIITLTNVRAKQWLTFGFMLPMMIPPQVTALAWLQLSGPASPLLNTLGIAPPLGSPQPLYSANGIALLLGIQSAPLVFLALRSQLINLPRELIEASRISGASTYRVWRDTILPLTHAGLISGASLAFISSLGNFGIPAMLGIPASYYTLPTLIYQKMAGFGASILTEIATLACCIGIITLIGIVFQQYLLKRSEYALLGQSKESFKMPLGKYRRLVEIIIAAVLWVILVIPLVALIFSSLVHAIGMPVTLHTMTLAAYHEIIFKQQTTIRAATNSLLLAAGAAVVLMLLGLLTVYIFRYVGTLKQMVAFTLVDLPYALPGVVLAIACIMLFVKPIPIVNIQLYSTLWIIFIAYLMRFFSVALKPIQAGASQLSPSLEQAAQLAGANAFHRLKDIFLPLIAPSMAAGGILVFLIAVNELTVSALLWSAGNETLGVMVYNLEDGGFSVLASALSVLIVIMVVAVMMILTLFGKQLPKGVIPWEEYE